MEVKGIGTRLESGGKSASKDSSDGCKGTKAMATYSEGYR